MYICKPNTRSFNQLSSFIGFETSGVLIIHLVYKSPPFKYIYYIIENMVLFHLTKMWVHKIHGHYLNPPFLQFITRSSSEKVRRTFVTP